MYDMMMFFPALNMHVLVHLVVMLAWKKKLIILLPYDL